MGTVPRAAPATSSRLREIAPPSTGRSMVVTPRHQAAATQVRLSGEWRYAGSLRAPAPRGAGRARAMTAGPGRRPLWRRGAGNAAAGPAPIPAAPAGPPPTTPRPMTPAGGPTAPPPWGGGPPPPPSAAGPTG